MNEINALINKINLFVKARNWQKFHNPKDLSISLALEAAEVLEHFQWQTPKQIKQYIKTNKGEIADELADVAIYLLQLVNYLDIDLIKAIETKMIKNGKKYPLSKLRGKTKLKKKLL